MASFFIIVLSLLMTFCGGVYAGEDVDDKSISTSLIRYGCSYCCSRIDNQTTILNGISSATDKLTKDVGEIKTGVEDDIPSELKRQAADLEELSAELNGQRVGQEELSAELKRQGVGQEELSAELKRQGVGQEELSAELKGQGVELGKVSSEIKEVKSSVGDISISLNRHTEDLLVHDTRLKEQGVLLSELKSLVKDIHGSLTGPKDCSDIRAMGHSTSGVYRVYPGSLAERIQADVYCDMKTPGGNWLVFQRRKDGSVNFERTWNEYGNGFGNPSGEFWLGNEALYLLTSNGKYKLRIDMEDFDGQKRYAEYSTFSVGSSTDKYRLTVSGYKGDAGNSFSGQGGMQFSTKDEDNDMREGSCSLLYHGAWWYSKCHTSNLNGLYLGGHHESYADGINWNSFRGFYYSLKITEMKIAAVK